MIKFILKITREFIHLGNILIIINIMLNRTYLQLIGNIYSRNIDRRDKIINNFLIL